MRAAGQGSGGRRVDQVGLGGIRGYQAWWDKERTMGVEVYLCCCMAGCSGSGSNGSCLDWGGEGRGGCGCEVVTSYLLLLPPVSLLTIW
jgi:hypothetical protein